ncbi:MAG: D-aminoacylase [Bauldia sp.]|uniref:N-acyl-D-amino-acid deacylase family protein n=1 Tax=Bauldia sp. TaxID=2575872 RepID=UPI001D5EED79|nr:D-aminoacylase [Bauldia sp.]MCB1495818.1 D-aminoacylase [Bauldia sp.]
MNPIPDDTESRYDHIFRNALIYDGSDSGPFPGEVAVRGDRIAAVAIQGTIPVGAAREEHDLKGKALAPGFIDSHTHDDRIVLDSPGMLPKISQGVTTVIAGNCGISLAPVTFEGNPPPPMNLLGGREAYAFPTFADYARAIDEATPGVNVAALIGHSALRLATMSNIEARASEAEISAMLDRVDEAMDNGAAGFSTGLFYPTNAGADAGEVARIATRFAERGGVYATHMRDETAHVLDSIAESVSTAEQARIQLIISHHKCAGVENWGRTRETLPVIKAAADRLPIAIDAYPYDAGSTNLRLDLVTDVFRIMITWSEPHPEVAGRDLSDIAAEWGVDLHEAARRLDPAGAIYFLMNEEDVQRVLSFPLTMIGSDGLPHDKHPHPRLWGTFPRVIGHYARELGLFPIEIAIHKMTGLTASVFNLEDRGRIAEGFFADLVVFDPSTIVDRATYEDPQLFSAGIEKVFVNGRMSWVAGATTVHRNGRLVGRRSA